ncbi:hypothetical protein SAMN05518849_105136 [Sphingobium sp. AP50]|uniref:hypothetical protein n=1 Tax=Sphingobium sp. AP50 TaxID=1884369 RepID=UPI0008D431BB|nr:hypothetical protein [Sphingobium sp. AP50]SEJ34569.1 hypothetical protein SAMN05518849_105136 [Sphingobium sp. AP50]
MRLPLLSWILPGTALIGLAACGGPTAPKADEVTNNNVAPANVVAQGNDAAQSPMSTPPAAAETPMAQPLSCAAEIGSAAAARRVKLCRDVSPATHPPCNAANSCAMIEDEIARSCALFDGDGPSMAGCTPAPKSMAAAAAVVSRYYSAINARDYGTAWTQWGENGRPGQTLAQFEGGFAHTRSTRVTIGRLAPGDGGAGSIYQTVPVTVDSQLSDGTRQRFTGDYIVRRVNDVDGASPAQLRWHIDQAKLKAVPAG